MHALSLVGTPESAGTLGFAFRGGGVLENGQKQIPNLGSTMRFAVGVGGLGNGEKQATNLSSRMGVCV